ncbi:rhomboid family intramembrane serine protease [Planctomycetota bacterium]
MLILPFKTENPVTGFSPVTYILIGINTVVFIISLFLSAGTVEILTMELGFVPEEWYRIHTVITSLFMHMGWAHLIVNMYFLWMFGRIVEQQLRPLRYTLLYILSGIIGLIVHSLTVSSYFSDLPCVGASGSISGILGAFAICHPRLKLTCLYIWILFIRPLVGIIQIPAFLFIGGWFILQLIYATSLGDITGAVGVAFWAHIGGFCFGAMAAGGKSFFSWGYRQLSILKTDMKYQRVLRYMHAGQLSPALSLLNTVSDDPDFTHPADYLKLQCCAQTGNSSEISDLGEKVLDGIHGTGTPGVAVNVFYILTNTNLASVLTPHHLLGIGRSFMKLRKYAYAEDIFYTILRDYPDNKENDLVLLAISELYTETGESERAQNILNLLIRFFPDSASAEAAQWKKK